MCPYFNEKVIGMKHIKGYILVVIGSFFMGLGIALTKCAELGVSTISSVPNVVSIRFPALSLGTLSSIWNFVMIAAQIVILRKEFKPIQFLQIPVSIIFGWFTDFGVWIFSYIPTDLYIIKLLLSVSGIVVLGFGIALTVLPGTVMNPGEAIVKVVADKLGKDFGNAKIVFDIGFVAFAAMLSLIFFNFRIIGIREGTIIAMFGTGICIKFFMKLFKRRNNAS